MTKKACYLIAWVGLATACGTQIKLESSAVETSDAALGSSSPVLQDALVDQAAATPSAATGTASTGTASTEPSLVPPMAPLPRESDLIDPAKMITGAFLSHCIWMQRGKILNCNVASADSGILIQSSQFRMELHDSLAGLIVPRSYTVNSLENSINLNITISLHDFMPNVSVYLKNLVVPSSQPVYIASPSIEASSNEVIAFESRNFGGAQRRGLKVGTYTRAEDFASFANSFASLKIPPNLAVQVCGNLDAAELCRDYYGDVPDLYYLANKLTSIRIYASLPFVTVFRDWSHGAGYQTIPVGTCDYSQLLPEIIDQISSFHIPQGLHVETFLSAGFSGGQLDILPGEIDIVSERNDLIKSLRVKVAP